MEYNSVWLALFNITEVRSEKSEVVRDQQDGEDCNALILPAPCPHLQPRSPNKEQKDNRAGEFLAFLSIDVWSGFNVFYSFFVTCGGVL